MTQKNIHRNTESHNASTAKNMDIKHRNARKRQYVANVVKRNIAQTNAKALTTNVQDAMEIMQHIIMSVQEKSKKASEKQRPNDKLLHISMNNTSAITRNKNNIAIL